MTFYTLVVAYYHSKTILHQKPEGFLLSALLWDQFASRVQWGRLLLGTEKMIWPSQGHEKSKIS